MTTIASITTLILALSPDAELVLYHGASGWTASAQHSPHRCLARASSYSAEMALEGLEDALIKACQSEARKLRAEAEAETDAGESDLLEGMAIRLEAVIAESISGMQVAA